MNLKKLRWMDEKIRWLIVLARSTALNMGSAKRSSYSSPLQEYLMMLSNPDNMMKITRYQVKSIGPAAIQGRGAGGRWVSSENYENWL